MERVSEILGDNRPVIFSFYAPWCPHCQRMRPVVEKLREDKGDSVRIESFDISDSKNRELLQHYRIEHIPTMLFFKDKEMVWRDSGEVEYEQLKKIIDRYKY